MKQDWGSSSIVGHKSTIHELLGWIHPQSYTRKEEKKKKGKERDNKELIPYKQKLEDFITTRSVP